MKATASMVVFINGEADKNEYRHFKIRQKNPKSDFDSIKEVSQRRRHQSWDNPNLIIIDGGKSQINAFETIYPKIGIAKNPDRLMVGDKKIKLVGNALNLVQRLRNEAHRFARRYHHNLISKNLIQ